MGRSQPHRGTQLPAAATRSGFIGMGKSLSFGLLRKPLLARVFGCRSAAQGRPAGGCHVQSLDSLDLPVLSTYVYRFVGLEALPARLTDFDLQHFFQLGDGDVLSIRQRFRSASPSRSPGAQAVRADGLRGSRSHRTRDGQAPVAQGDTGGLGRPDACGRVDQGRQDRRGRRATPAGQRRAGRSRVQGSGSSGSPAASIMLKLAQALGFENDPAEPAASEVRRVVKRLWPVNAVPGLIGVKGMVAGVGGAVLLGL
jgi:hypothetical protein